MKGTRKACADALPAAHYRHASSQKWFAKPAHELLILTLPLTPPGIAHHLQLRTHIRRPHGRGPCARGCRFSEDVRIKRNYHFNSDSSTTEYINAMPQAANEALQMLATAGKFIVKSINITLRPVENLIPEGEAKANYQIVGSFQRHSLQMRHIRITQGAGNNDSVRLCRK